MHFNKYLISTKANEGVADLTNLAEMGTAKNLIVLIRSEEFPPQVLL